MNRETPLLPAALMSVGRFDRPAGEAHRDPDEEGAGFFSALNPGWHLDSGR